MSKAIYMLDILLLAKECAPAVHVVTTRALVNQESGGNPYAIGVVNGRLERQPRNKEEAIATAEALRKNNRNFSAGLAQINVHNWEKLNLNMETVFDPCKNLTAMQSVLHECWSRAKQRFSTNENVSIRASLSCYYSGSFVLGEEYGYVDSVIAKARTIRASFLVSP